MLDVDGFVLVVVRVLRLMRAEVVVGIAFEGTVCGGRTEARALVVIGGGIELRPGFAGMVVGWRVRTVVVGRRVRTVVVGRRVPTVVVGRRVPTVVVGRRVPTVGIAAGFGGTVGVVATVGVVCVGAAIGVCRADANEAVISKRINQQISRRISKRTSVGRIPGRARGLKRTNSWYRRGSLDFTIDHSNRDKSVQLLMRWRTDA